MSEVQAERAEDWELGSLLSPGDERDDEVVGRGVAGFGVEVQLIALAENRRGWRMEMSIEVEVEQVLKEIPEDHVEVAVPVHVSQRHVSGPVVVLGQV